MDAFDNEFTAPAATPTGGEVDPAAEFLANEQKELADLTDELDLSAQPNQDAPVAVDNNELVTNGDEDFFNMGGGTQETVTADILGDQLAPVQNIGEVLHDVPDSQGALSDDMFFQNGSEAGMTEAATSNPFGSPAISTSQDEGLNQGFSKMQMREEPECIKKWKVEQEERLREKDAEEELKKTELKEKAKKELEDWYKRYEEQLAKTKATNRDAQEEFVAEINNIAPGTEWERVAKHCDFNPKSTRHTKDVSRMRSLLLQLKQTPPARD